MKLYGDPERAKANLAAGRERSRLHYLKRNGPPVRPPDRGALLKTMRITDHIKGISYVITIHQGDRLNSIEPRLHGRPFIKSIACGFDELFRALRKRWSLRWLIVN